MRIRLGLVVALASAVLLESGVAPAAPTAPREAVAECPVDEVPLFAVGSSPATPGFFFPGTAVYDGSNFQGVPYSIPQGCNLQFVNLDVSAVANGHQVVSLRRRRGRPLFRSEFSPGPGILSIRTSHLKVGVYPYFCTIHAGMFGLLEITA